ncbi:MAG: hypothetical protein JXP37_04390 [Coriobacteriia bacterium]|nr:hypothetical protein [Coriobacteriia bacterium]
MGDEKRPVPVTIEWSYRVPLLTSRFMLWDFLRVTLLSVLGMYVLVALMGLIFEGEFIVLPLQVFVLVTAIMLALFVLASLLLGNHVPMTFSVRPEGVSYGMGGRQKGLNRATVALGVLSGSPATAGAGLLAASREQGSWSWEQLHGARYFDGQHVISLRNSWRTVLRLHCTADDHVRIRVAVAEGLARGAAARAVREDS